MLPPALVHGARGPTDLSPFVGLVEVFRPAVALERSAGLDRLFTWLLVVFCRSRAFLERHQ
jgi:hypothetical protein